MPGETHKALARDYDAARIQGADELHLTSNSIALNIRYSVFWLDGVGACARSYMYDRAIRHILAVL